MSSFFHEAVEENPIIAAVKNMDDLKICCSLEDIRVVFILFGDVCSIREIVQQIKDSGKVAMVHVDLISGLSSKEIVVDFIRKNTEADGIISTKAALIKRGKELKMFTVLRYFLLDSMAYENIRQQQHAVKPDYIEVLPGVMPKVIGKVCKMSKTPIIAGGDLAELQKITDEEQELVSRIHNLDKQREGVTADIADLLNRDVKDLKLPNLITMLAARPAEQQALADSHDRLQAAVRGLQRVNEQNSELLKSALEMVEFEMNLLQAAKAAPETANYNRGAYNAGDTMGVADHGFDAKQ